MDKLLLQARPLLSTIFTTYRQQFSGDLSQKPSEDRTLRTSRGPFCRFQVRSADWDVCYHWRFRKRKGLGAEDWDRNDRKRKHFKNLTSNTCTTAGTGRVFHAAGNSRAEGITAKVPSSDQRAMNSNQLAKILNNYDPHSAVRKGIEIKFRHVDLSESVSFLICDRFFISVQCKKCKKIADFQLFPARRAVTSCARCQTKLEACFRPCILLQFNPVVGYLELDDCTVRDVALPRCHFYADCQSCLKLNPFEGIHMGQRVSSNCLTCGIKMQLIIDSIKFIDMCAIDANIKASQVKKANKDSAIQAGKPLPNKGICKHYKKSFRWFRFPCCGKAYPCDDCHNEQESDHTAEFASRMICGFCAKEQPFSNDKPCLQCSNFITGKRTAHWEGGKGCRNKAKMSANDAKKYTGLNKTISRKVSSAKSKWRTWTWHT